MRKSKRDKKVKKVFNATTEKMKELITNENDLKIFTYTLMLKGINFQKG